MAASSSIQLLTPALAILVLSFLKLSTSARASAGSCYKSIISFGDSLTDTGNLVQLFPPDNTTHCHRPPYGETFFNHPTGRCSNGRLIIDFFGTYAEREISASHNLSYKDVLFIQILLSFSFSIR